MSYVCVCGGGGGGVKLHTDWTEEKGRHLNRTMLHFPIVSGYQKDMTKQFIQEGL